MRPAKFGLFVSVLVAGVVGFWSVNAQDTGTQGPGPELGTETRDTGTEATTGDAEKADHTADLPVQKPNYRTDVSTTRSSQVRAGDGDLIDTTEEIADNMTSPEYLEAMDRLAAQLAAMPPMGSN